MHSLVGSEAVLVGTKRYPVGEFGRASTCGAWFMTFGGSGEIKIQQRAGPDAHVAMYFLYGGTLCVYVVSYSCARGHERQGR